MYRLVVLFMCTVINNIYYVQFVVLFMCIISGAINAYRLAVLFIRDVQCFGVTQHI